MKHLVQTVGLSAVIPLLMLSCTDDPFGVNNLQSDSEMCFTTQMAESTSSRADNDNLESFTADKCENSDIYLVTTVEDGIDGTKLDSYDKDAEKKVYEAMNMAQSRAAQLTAESLVSSYLQNEGYSIGLYAYKYPKKDSYNGQTTSNYTYTLSDVITEFGADSLDVVKIIDGENLTYASQSSDKTTVTLTSASKHYWDKYDSNCMTFCALFPSKEAYANFATTTYVKDTYAVHTSHNRAVMRFAIETDPSKQVDFLYAQKSCSGNGSSSSNNIPLSMQHIMTGINVTLGEGFSGYYITNVRFGGETANSNRAVNTLGHFNLATGLWEALPNGEKFTSNVEYTCDASEQNSSLDGKLFMVIPQTLGSSGSSTNGGITASCFIAITVQNPTTNATETYTKDITGTVWPQGKTVNYQLSTTRSDTKYYITTEYSVMKYGWNGEPAGNGTSYSNTAKTQTIDDVGYIRVKSYKRTTTSNGSTTTKNYEAVPWTAYDESNNQVTTSASSGLVTSTHSYATDYRTYDENDADYEFEQQSYNFMFKHTIGRQTQNTTNHPSKESKTIASRKNVTFGSSSEYVDLSKYKQSYVSSGNSNTAERWYKNANKSEESRETSNCYMIQYPGYYEIPCVYGNGIHLDAEFKTGFQSVSVSNKADYCLNNFVRHDGATISNNWINSSNSGSNPTTPVSVWQDVYNLVSGLTIYNPTGKNEYYLRFIVSSSTIKPGNAVIAIKNASGDIMWSWHIWVTPWAGNDKFAAQPSENGTSTLKSSKAQFLKVPLGFVEGDTIEWAARTKVLTLKQQDSSGNLVGQTTTITLQQDAHLLPQQYCCYYQWGRKDPFPGAKVTEDQSTGGVMDFGGNYTTTTTRVTLYNLNAGSSDIIAAANSSTVADAIKRPYWYYSQLTSSSSNKFPTDKNYVDLWGCTSHSTSVVTGSFDATIGSSGIKTIYDPCPIEFKVPPIHAFPQLNSTCGNLSTTKADWSDVARTEQVVFRNLNSPYQSVAEVVNNAGIEFYCNGMSGEGLWNTSGGTYKLPAFGYIDPVSDAGKGKSGYCVYQNVGTRGWYWSNARSANGTAATGQNSYGIMFGYLWSQLFINQIYGHTESRGEPVLPMYDTYNPVY